MNKVPVLLLATLLAFAALPAAAQSGEATLSFAPQSSGGRVVLVAYVNLPEAGFVALHDATLLSAQDPFGSVVGVSESLPAGNHTNLHVVLSRALRGANETLIAMPHKDTNGNGVYDFVSSKGAQDGPFVGGRQATQTFAGNIVVAPAQVNVTAAVHAMSPQPSAGNSLVVEHVDLSQGGFLAVHDSTLVSAQDPFGSVVGVSRFLEPGLHRHVVVEFTFNESKRNVTGPVVPMPHKDTNNNRVYDFVSSRGAQDGPFAGDAQTFVGPIVIQVVDLTRTIDASVNFTATSSGGRLLVVPQVFLPEGGFLAVHDSTLVNAQDPFGSVVGVSPRLPAGQHVNVAVELTRFTMNASETLIVMPHKDTNDNAVYDFVTSRGAQDGPFVGGPNATQTFAGNIVIASANVTRSSAVLFTPKESDGRSVRIDAVDLSEDGFLALHDLSLVTKQDPFGSVVGVSAKLPAGLHRNVTVTFSQAGNAAPLNGSATLVAMPHKDTNDNGVYDFVTSRGAQDGPFAGATSTFAGNLNIALGRVSAPPAVPAAGTPGTPTPATPGTPTPSTPTRATPTATPTMATPTPSTPGATPTNTVGTPTPTATPTEPTESADTPGFTLVVLVAALAAALLVLRRR